MAPRPATWYSRYPKKSRSLKPEMPTSRNAAACFASRSSKSPVDHEGVHGEHDQPRPYRHAHAENRDSDGEQEDRRYREASYEEEAHGGRVLGFVQQPVVPRRVPVDGRQQKPAHGEGCGVDGHRQLVVAVLAEERGGEGHERHHHEEQEVEIQEAAVVGPYGAEDAVVDQPERADPDEAQEVAEILGPKREQRTG